MRKINLQLLVIFVFSMFGLVFVFSMSGKCFLLKHRVGLNIVAIISPLKLHQNSSTNSGRIFFKSTFNFFSRVIVSKVFVSSCQTFSRVLFLNRFCPISGNFSSVLTTEFSQCLFSSALGSQDPHVSHDCFSFSFQAFLALLIVNKNNLGFVDSSTLCPLLYSMRLFFPYPCCFSQCPWLTWGCCGSGFSWLHGQLFTD